SRGRASLPEHRLRLRFGRHSDRSQRAPRTQVVVPGGRLPCLPRRAVASRRRETPLPAPPSGSPPETPLNERGCESSTTSSYRSQYINAICNRKIVPGRLIKSLHSVARLLRPGSIRSRGGTADICQERPLIASDAK